MSDLMKSGFSRNSFERFGDDLNQEILQYLSFEDKINYECVCKQFKFNIYKRQNELQLKGINNITFDTFNVLIFVNNKSEMNKIIIKSEDIEILLKKCTEINHIIFGENDYVWKNFNSSVNVSRVANYGKLFRIIADNCHNLLSFDCIDIEIKATDDIWHYFFSKRGNNLQSIIFTQFDLISYGMKSGLTHFCPNITCIENIKLSQLIDNNTIGILAPKLRAIKILEESKSYKLDHINNLLSIFVNRYMASIQVFNIEINSNINSIQLFDCLPKLINLKKLSIERKHFSGKSETPSDVFFFETLKSISNCAKLEYLHLCIYTDKENKEKLVNSKDELSVNLLKNCNELKYLKINSNLINDNFVRNIGNCLPKLKHITIITYLLLTDKTLIFLSQAKQLTTIDLNIPSADETYTDIGIAKLLDNCIAIKSITLNWCNYKIIALIINKLIEIAKQRPKINFNIKFRNIIKLYKTLQDHNEQNIPPNLNIIYLNNQRIID